MMIRVTPSGALDSDLRRPIFLGIGKRGEQHFLEMWSKRVITGSAADSKTMVLLDVPIERQTEKYLPAKQVGFSDLRFQLREMLHGLESKPKPWQMVVAIQTDWLIRQARGLANKNWILNTGCILAKHGEKMFTEARGKLSAVAKSGYLTIRQLAKLWPVTVNQKTLRRWLQARPWTKQEKGGNCRVRICDDFCWWYVKQLAGDLARELLKNKKLEVNDKGFETDDGKIVGIERHALEALGDRAQLYTKTVGLTLEEIAEDLKKPEVAEEELPFAGDEHVDTNRPPTFKERLSEERQRMTVWNSDLKSLPPELFIIPADEARLRVACLKLRKQSLAHGRSGHVSITALAKELDVSRDTFYRHKSWVEFYRKWYREKEHQRTIRNDEIDRPEDLQAQGVQVTASPEKGTRPHRLPKNYAEVAQPHLEVVWLYEGKIRDPGGKTLTRADLAAYLKSLEVDERWALWKTLQDRGYADDKLYAMGFPRLKKPAL